jgi:hypothetical protein
MQRGRTPPPRAMPMPLQLKKLTVAAAVVSVPPPLLLPWLPLSLPLAGPGTLNPKAPGARRGV